MKQNQRMKNRNIAPEGFGTTEVTLGTEIPLAIIRTAFVARLPLAATRRESPRLSSLEIQACVRMKCAIFCAIAAIVSIHVAAGITLKARAPSMGTVD